MHVICPETKPKCFGALGRCAKTEVALTISNGSNNVQLTFNKGCSCQMLADFIGIGDGN